MMNHNQLDINGNSHRLYFLPLLCKEGIKGRENANKFFSCPIYRAL